MAKSKVAVGPENERASPVKLEDWGRRLLFKAFRSGTPPGTRAALQHVSGRTRQGCMIDTRPEALGSTQEV